MKKTVKLLAVILTVIVGACFMFACSDTAGLKTEIDALKQQIGSGSGNTGLESDIDKLKDRIGELEGQIKELELDKSNVFWTEKEEYAEDETLIVYYGKKAVLSLRINCISIGPDADIVGGKIYITSLLTDLYTFSILQTAYITFNSEIYLNRATYDNNNICKKNIEITKGSYFKSEKGTFTNSKIDYTICVPGTPFPLASFKNIPVILESN